MYDPDVLRAELQVARATENIDEVRRIQNIMCQIYTRCDLCRACEGWKLPWRQGMRTN